MNAKILKKEIIKEIEILPIEELKTVAEFVDFVREKQFEDKILNSPKIIREVNIAKRDWLSGKKNKFINFEELKKKL